MKSIQESKTIAIKFTLQSVKIFLKSTKMSLVFKTIFIGEFDISQKKKKERVLQI